MRLAGSPFVLTFAKIGITAAAGIINFVVLTAALSAVTAEMWQLWAYALRAGEKPSTAGGRESLRHGVPVAGVVSIFDLLVGSCLNYYIIPNPQRTSLFTFIAPAFLRGWCRGLSFLISQLRFRRA
ncbi:hypothetical protein KCP77_01300 [Salmonella enterica subsp. enterica]|nr:hypothetical protein KCP77_01300 [Salmonella enterica subsp. enterica]